ncbi:PEP-CTERM sorting domain-containing protein [Pseudoduganella rhizocola]|uniref:PEP-CTERM sorting domain-containing protein n=1 Tax=Pseudoduganella rhizocola TaxID=3382643 RepID=UPI0038B4FACD
MRITFSLLVLALAGPAQAADNLVVNPGFMAGSYGWQTSRSGLLVSGLPGHEDAGLAYIGCVELCPLSPGQGTFIGQTVATTPGRSYDLRFWSDASASRLAVFWQGQLVTPELVQSNGAGWNEFRFTGLLARAPATSFEVHAFRIGGPLRKLDNFSITSAIPEPNGAAMLAIGLGLLVLVRRCVSPGWRYQRGWRPFGRGTEK